MSNFTFSSPDLSSFCQLNNLGLVATGQQLCAERAVIECRFTKAPEPCPRCGAVGASRGTLKAFPWGGTLGIAAIVLDDLSVSRIANHLGVAWHTVNNAITNEGQRLLFNDPKRFDGVTVLGVDEHVWRHTRRGDKYVTIVADLTPCATKPDHRACWLYWKAAPSKP